MSWPENFKGTGNLGNLRIDKKDNIEVDFKEVG
jgi:hypothetical protein